MDMSDGRVTVMDSDIRRKHYRILTKIFPDGTGRRADRLWDGLHLCMDRSLGIQTGA
jgi:hypothetical protein